MSTETAARCQLAPNRLPKPKNNVATTKGGIWLAIGKKIVIVGRGAGVASRLLHAGCTDITLIEPSEHHYYQPLWTLVGAGVVKREQSLRPMARLNPRGAKWIRDAVADFDPTANFLSRRSRNQTG